VAFIISRGIMDKVPADLKEIFTPAQWKKLQPEDKMIVASGAWQDSSNFGTNATAIDTTIDLFPYPKTGWKATHKNWRTLQNKGWQIYNGFGPLRAAIESKADYVAKGLQINATRHYELDAFLQDIWYSPQNEMYNRFTSWMIRMFAEVEVFVLLVFDDEGNVTIRNLEPQNIGKSTTDTGLLSDPDDVNTTLFYLHKSKDGDELIPDARFILEPEYMTERAKALKGDLDQSLIKKFTKSPKHRAIGGYRRFVLHWRNLTGEMNIPRGTSSISAIIEWVNLLIMAIKWELDYKKALCAYTILIKFTDTPAGKLAWHLWSKMTTAQKDATNLTKPLTPGSKVFLLPGMDVKIESPTLPKMSGSNDDLVFLSGAGARTPQDLWQGQSAGATNASLKASRHPLMMEIEALQEKAESFLRYKLLRSCITAKIKMGGQFTPFAWMTDGKGGETLTLDPEYEKPWVEVVLKGKATVSTKKCEPVDPKIISFKFPVIKLDADANMGTLFFGSKNSGMHGGGISRKTLMEKAGVHGFDQEIREHYIEKEEYGDVTPAPDQGQAQGDNKDNPQKEKGGEGGAKE